MPRNQGVAHAVIEQQLAAAAEERREIGPMGGIAQVSWIAIERERVLHLVDVDGLLRRRRDRAFRACHEDAGMVTSALPRCRCPRETVDRPGAHANSWVPWNAFFSAAVCCGDRYRTVFAPLQVNAAGSN